MKGGARGREEGVAHAVGAPPPLPRALADIRLSCVVQRMEGKGHLLRGGIGGWWGCMQHAGYVQAPRCVAAGARFGIFFWQPSDVSGRRLVWQPAGRPGRSLAFINNGCRKQRAAPAVLAQQHNRRLPWRAFLLVCPASL